MFIPTRVIINVEKPIGKMGKKEGVETIWFLGEEEGKNYYEDGVLEDIPNSSEENTSSGGLFGNTFSNSLCR